MTASAPTEATEPAELTYDDVVVLVRWMATGWPSFDASEIAHAVEKPQKWANEIPHIRAANAHAVACPGHTPGMDDDGSWCCSGRGGTDCSWPGEEGPAPA